MRLQPDKIQEGRRSERGPVRGEEARFGLFGPLYLALWLNATLLAVMVCAGRNPETCLLDPRLQAAGWAAGLSVAAWLAWGGRIALHDLIVGLGLRDRLLLGLFILLPAALPALMRGPRVVIDGPLWATPLVLLLAVSPAPTRRLLALTLAGAWLAAGRLDGEFGLYLTLGFGVSWLAALGATHFAHTGEPHGLGGMWPVRKVLANTLAAGLPAGVAGALIWMAWPKAMPALNAQTGRVEAPPTPARAIERLDPVEQETLLYWGVATIAVTMLLIVFLHYLRKWLLRRMARGVATTLMPGQVAQIEMRAEAPAQPERPQLSGMRGRIVALWGKWAAALAQAGEERGPGETAAAYAARLAAEREGLLRPPEAMTALLERAHYGAAEPTREDLAVMQQYVKDEVARVRQAGGLERRKGKK